MIRIKLLSSDLNGTLVHQNTMSDMIRIYIGQYQFKQADAVFKRQLEGKATIKEAFQIAAPLTKGLTLRQAIEYTKNHVQYVNGFDELLFYLSNNNTPLVINSTAYSVTIYAIQQIGKNKIHGHIGNSLKFGLNGDTSKTLSETELKEKIKAYFSNSDTVEDKSYDKIQATGEIELSIPDEDAKSTLIQQYAKDYFPEITPKEIAHIGDTMGDSGCILGIASIGGIGIAFNYNAALRQFLEDKMKKERIDGSIYFIDPKSESSNLSNIIPILNDGVIEEKT